ncbi:MAG: zinc carboxypeptidase, partial [Bacteroidales bacterium]|nr:zinc carboxypeptidase [Bacteroidales bacterium]
MKYLLFLALFFLTFNVTSQYTPGNSVLDELYAETGEQYFRFQVDDISLINQLSRVISIDMAEMNGTVHAYANRKEFSAFLDYSIPYEILPHPGYYEGDLNIKDHIDIRELHEWDFYPTYDAYVDMMYQFAAQYPSLCQVFSIGNTNGGRTLLVARISDNVGVRENEPQFLYTSSMHGDETTGYVLMLRLIDYLLSNYGVDPRITSLVDNIEIWINPLANPDGTYWGGNNTVNNAKRYNAHGVDLNRNYPDPAAGPHPDGNEWQIETVAFMQMAENNNFVSSANIHGGAEVCNYPWDTWSRLTADDAWWKYVCREYADTAHFYSPSGYMTGFDNGITNGYA